MKCPYCSHNETKVLDSRESENNVRRRRECLKCSKRFTTYEKVEIDLIVIKKDGNKEPFDREKVLKGMLKACEKRPLSQDQINQSIDKVELELKSLKTNEVKSHTIGEKVMKYLKKLDKVAYIRFASVYKEFEDVDSFEKEIVVLQKRR
ncbi:transcriptional regulator NrdR [archaeon]|nr:transcriptional regulator NrdR [archaeon]